MNFPEIEHKILKFWAENKIFEKLRQKNRGNKRWSFLDGPITANNPMGVHHAWGRTYKDLFQRYKALQGFDQRFQNGFDCQGLWVEVEVEKELGFKTKKDIEVYGIEKFVDKCKERVKKYSKIQTEQSIRLGQWMDWDNSYYTLSDENNYAIWHFLKICWQRGLLYKGRDVVPWCLRCGTAISQHEILSEEYQEISHKAVYFKLPLISRKNTFFLGWTTTPWTLPANVALALNQKLEYAEVENENKEIFILLKEKAHLIPGGKIIKTFKGEKMKGAEYEGLFDELPAVDRALGKYQHQVILWDEVSLEEGTGIVHIAPGCGQEDFKLSQEFNLPVVDPTDDESRYQPGFGFLAGKLVTEARDNIFETLEKKGAVFKIEDYRHRYPTCWRCKSELIFRLVDEWYISMEKLRQPLMAVAKKIKWIPDFGLERELDWLKNMQDWLISKKRYWGLSLPIYECGCGQFEVIGSKEELGERAVEGWSEFKNHSPHRPFTDRVKIKCSRCGQKVSRIPDVGNPWLDAGIVPFSTIGYFEDKKHWADWFPADFICESFPGQFKNWFYSLIVMSTVLENTNPAETIFGYALVRDEKGEEMHKSKSNAIWLDTAVEKIGADPMRWLYARQNPAYNLNFGYQAADEVKSKLLTLWNSFVFLQTYADKKELKPALSAIKSNNILDKWIISCLHNLIGKVTRHLDEYNAASASLAVEDFFINGLSLWYIRRSRRRFQKPESPKEKKEAVSTLYYVILDLIKIISPFMPFWSEDLYQQLKAKGLPESVHLCAWPKEEKELINQSLEEKMKKTRKIVAQALAQRVKAGLKVRQPLGELRIAVSELKKEPGLLGLIKDEVNVKKITFGKNLALDTKITPKLKEEGLVREIIRQVQELRKKSGLKPQDKILVKYAAPETLAKILEKNKNFLKKELKTKEFASKSGPEAAFGQGIQLELAGQKLWIGIKKI